MKKAFTLLLALCLLLCGMALADTYSSAANDAKTILTTTLDESFTVVIPSDMNIAFNKTSTDLTIEVTALRLMPAGRALQVQVNKTSSQLVNSESSSSKINYTIHEKNGTADKLSFTQTGKQYFQIDIAQAEWDKAPAGTYTDTLTFNVGIINQ